MPSFLVWSIRFEFIAEKIIWVTTMWIGFYGAKDMLDLKKVLESEKVTCLVLASITWHPLRCLSLNSAGIIKHLSILGDVVYPVD